MPKPNDRIGPYQLIRRLGKVKRWVALVNNRIVQSIQTQVDADLTKLAAFSTRKPVRMQGLKFRELFLWLSRSTTSASKQAPGSNVQLAPPSDWMQVSS